jgi:integrase
MGQARLHHINRAMINAFIAKRQSAGISGRTVNLDVIVLRNVLRRAIDDGWIKTLPTENLRPLKWTAKKRLLVSAEEINHLCHASKEATKNGQQFSDYIRLMAYSGARRNEVLRLTWADVNWERKQIAVGSDGLAKNRESRVVDFNSSLEMHLKDMFSVPFSFTPARIQRRTSKVIRRFAQTHTSSKWIENQFSRLPSLLHLNGCNERD